MSPIVLKQSVVVNQLIFQGGYLVLQHSLIEFLQGQPDHYVSFSSARCCFLLDYLQMCLELELYFEDLMLHVMMIRFQVSSNLWLLCYVTQLSRHSFRTLC